MNVDVLYEDNHIIAANKPSGLLTQDSGTGRENLEDALRAFIVDKYQKKGGAFVHALHRLDCQASGIVLFTKTRKALHRMARLQIERKIEKKYLLCIEGHLEEKQGVWEDYLVHDKYVAKIVSRETEGAKKALLRFRVKNEGAKRSLIEVELMTGRYHQIRCQIAGRGRPIWGDVKYGSVQPYEKEGIALHHTLMAFEHPVQKRPLILESQPPLWICD